MSAPDPPVMSTPSRPRHSLGLKRSGTFSNSKTVPGVAGFSPGGQVMEGYSYLSRSSSISTSTRSRPKGLQSRHSEISSSPSAMSVHLPSSPSVPGSILSHQPSLPSPSASPSKRSTDLPQRRNTIHRMPNSASTPELGLTIGGHLPRSGSEAERLAEAVSNLPTSPKVWTPSQVALYLTHVLGLVPRPVVEDVAAYVRSSRMGGRAFLRLSEKELERQGLNLKWRKLMIEAVRKLRRDALRGRIWGNGDGSIRWPKSALELEKEQSEFDDGQDQSPPEDEAINDDDGIVRNTKTTSKLTLKRMRDSRKVRGMIQAFQTSPAKEDPTSPSTPLDAIYGEGYVKEQADHFVADTDKKLSLRRPVRPRRSTAEFPWLNHDGAETKREDIEALLAGLSEQEAKDLAIELGLEDLQDPDQVVAATEAKIETDARREGSAESAEEVSMMPTLHRHGGEHGCSAGESSVSECSGTDSELDTPNEPSQGGGHRPRYSVLDEDIIRAILAEAAALDVQRQEAPARAGLLRRSNTTAASARPEHPYRASLYTEEELAAVSQSTLHTRTDSSRELVEGLQLSNVESGSEMSSPKFGTARLRMADERTVDAPIPAFDTAASNSSANSDEYIFEAPQTNATKPFAKTGSIRQRNNKATFGSKRGKAMLSLLNKGLEGDNSDLFASLPGVRASAAAAASGGSNSMRRKKSNEATTGTAEDEEGWGGTLGRTSCRKSLASVFAEPTAPQGLVAPTPTTKANRSRPGSMAFRKQHLERVASEAEAEAFHAELDRVERNTLGSVWAEPVEIPVEVYHGPVSRPSGNEESEDEDAISRRPSIEQRLSSLFIGGAAPAQVDAASKEQDDEELAVSAVNVADVQVEAEANRAASPVSDETASLAPVETTNEAKDSSSIPESDSNDDALADDIADVEAEPKIIGIHEDVSAEPKIDQVEEAATSADAQDVDAQDVADVVEDTVTSQSNDEEFVVVSNELEGAPKSSSELEEAKLTTPVVDSAEASGTTCESGDDFVSAGFEAAPVAAEAEQMSVDASTTETETPAEVVVVDPKPADTVEEAGSKLLVPLTVIEPHPSGTGSIKKRSMVLVDRKRFESLARRMTELESQLEGLDTLPADNAHSRSASDAARATASRDLRTLFSGDAQTETDQEAISANVLESTDAKSQNRLPTSDDFLKLATQEDDNVSDAMLNSLVGGTGGETFASMETEVEVKADPSSSSSSSTSVPMPSSPSSSSSWWRSYVSPTSWARYLSSLNPYYSQPATARDDHDDDQLDLYALLGRSESEYERHLLSIGAIPAYMLGIGAGVGFVLVREVIGKSIGRNL
ncbi:hypothetical protein BCV70DRAFT_200424 [Testicularia cyperi]|uniref:SAM domain-containing protein n=1 Tax=Testicularia cyperi TaxID=1882483 RepID=A0A317XPT6_9BASI|nr:hypothetical protein BCV70DRAFT_200424 [Testicularia cyperi]